MQSLYRSKCVFPYLYGATRAMAEARFSVSFLIGMSNQLEVLAPSTLREFPLGVPTLVFPLGMRWESASERSELGAILAVVRTFCG